MSALGQKETLGLQSDRAVTQRPFELTLQTAQSMGAYQSLGLFVTEREKLIRTAVLENMDKSTMRVILKSDDPLSKLPLIPDTLVAIRKTFLLDASKRLGHL